MRRLATLLLALLLCGGVARADGDTVTAASTWYIHGIARTAMGQPVGGGTVELWRGTTRVAQNVMASQSFGFSPSQTAGVYQVRYTPPDGWRCVDVRSAGVGWQYPGGCVGQIALPEQVPSLGPDLVFVVAWIELPTPTPPPTAILSTPTATVQKPTQTATVCTPEPTMPMPPATPPLPTPRPMPTRPAGGWEPWEAPAPLVNALGMEVEWRLGVYAETDDPLWLAASSKGPTWPMMLPEVTVYDILNPDGTNTVTSLRWQMFLTPRGWRLAMAIVEEPYRVAVVEGEGW